MSERIAPIDPTKNVIDLVHAEARHRDALREADNLYQNAMREAETHRVDQLAAQKLMFDLELAKVLRANQDAASTLLATQLKEVKNDLSDRTAKLEQFRWESGGKSQGIGMIGTLIIGIAMSIASAFTVAGFVYSFMRGHG
jgi:hypothetical protein